MSVNGNFAELYRLHFAPAAPADHDPHILWADTTASPAVLKTYQGGAWVPVAGGGAGQGGGVSGVAVTPPATNTGTPTAPVIGVTPATAQAAGSLAAADFGKLAGVQAGAQANVLEGVTGTAPLAVAAVTNKAQAISIVAATASVPGSMSAADKGKLDGIAAGAGLATSVAVTAPATNSGTATAPNIGVTPATASEPGSLSAADFAKLASLMAPAAALTYALATDTWNGAALAANAYADACPVQAFNVSGTSAVFLFDLRMNVLFNATGAGIAQVVVRANIDNGASFIKLSALGGANTLWSTAPASWFWAAGFAAGTHTIKVQCAPNVNGLAYLRAAAVPASEFLEIRILQLSR